MKTLYVCLILLVVVLADIIISQCVIFKKMGVSWWKSLIPVYRQMIILSITGLPKWWAIASVIPALNVSYTITWGVISTYRLLLCFGCTKRCAVLYTMLPFISMPIIALSDAEFEELEW